MAKPYVILNAAMTLDGKICTIAGDSRISCPEDLKRLHKLRAQVDAVMVGVGTVLADNPALTVRLARGKNPTRVVVDSLARTPLQARVLDGSAPTVIAVSNKASKRKMQKLKQKARVLVVGGEKVDLRKLLGKLHKLGIRKLLLEGGSRLNWGMLSSGLVDEIRVSIAPRVVGGERAKTLVGGEGFSRVSEGVELKLVSTKRVGRDLLLTYKVRGRKHAPKSG